MDYQLALSPDVGLSPADFVAEWNISTECRTAAEARLDPSPGNSTDSMYVDGIVTLVETVGVDVEANAIYDLIKKLMQREGTRKVKITRQKESDGTQLLIVGSNEK